MGAEDERGKTKPRAPGTGVAPTVESHRFGITRRGDYPAGAQQVPSFLLRTGSTRLRNSGVKAHEVMSPAACKLLLRVDAPRSEIGPPVADQGAPLCNGKKCVTTLLFTGAL